MILGESVDCNKGVAQVVEVRLFCVHAKVRATPYRYTLYACWALTVPYSLYCTENLNLIS